MEEKMTEEISANSLIKLLMAESEICSLCKKGNRLLASANHKKYCYACLMRCQENGSFLSYRYGLKAHCVWCDYDELVYEKTRICLLCHDEAMSLFKKKDTVINLDILESDKDPHNPLKRGRAKSHR